MTTAVKTTEPKIEQRAAQPYMGLRVQVPMRDLGSAIPSSHQEVMGWLKANGVQPTGAPFCRYHVINMDGVMDIELGWPVAQALPDHGRVKANVLPAGRYAALIYTGVENGFAGNAALIDWAQAQGLTWDHWDVPQGDAFASRYETFITDPADEPDMSKWETEVAIKLAD